jgi:hypothetical protein
MPNTTHNNLPENILKLDLALQDLEVHPDFQNAQKASMATINLLGISSDIGFVPLSKVPGTVANQLELAEGYADKRAAYRYGVQDEIPVDIKLFWVQKTSKRTISSLVALTPNFEDESFYSDKNIGIDIVVPHSSDRLFIVLSSSYNIRLVELKGKLTNTQKEIFTKWVQDLDFSNKHQIHTILWDSLDLKSLNESFYKGIAGFFSELKIYLKEIPLFDDKSASHFANRLIGRLIFCWFIRKRDLINETKRYLEISPDEDSSNYYHDRLEKLFFSVLNTQVENRIFEDKETPFLNGGLFDPRTDDHKGVPSLIFPKDYFHRFFAFLNHYNFTTDESTSDYQQVAIDPEMLGRIFENLLAEQIEETGEQARKAKGAFYTPREIVDYMCRQSIREYLKSQLADEEGIDQVITDLMDTKEHAYDKNVREKITSYKQKLITALDNVKIIDPACGSGAFPMGMLKLLEHLYERIDVRYEPYETKLEIIKNNLFGVDIEPMAVEISRLRAWLSIIVDTDINPSKVNKGIEPLPNLDFKFVCANSLFRLDLKPKKEQLSLGSDIVGDDELINKLRDLRDEWFDSKDRTKKQIKDEFEDIQHKLFNNVLKDWNGTASREDKLKLVGWDPFSDKPADFFDPFWMFGIKDGFDIVIANPPYVSYGLRGVQKITKKEKDLLTKIFPNSAEYKISLYAIFMDKAIELSKVNGGIQTFIVPDSFLLGRYFSKIRGYILKSNEIVQISWLPYKIFDATVGYSVIYTFNRQSTLNESHIFSARLVQSNSDIPDKKYIQFSYPQSYFVGLKYNRFRLFFDSETKNLISKIDGSSIELGSIYTGRTGVRSKIGQKNIISKSKDGKFFQKGIISGSQITRYGLKYDGDYININPSLLNGGGWDYEIIHNPKILLRQTADNLIGTIDIDNYYHLNNVHSFAPKQKDGVELECILAILNSKLMNYFYQKTTLEKGRTMAQTDIETIESLPIRLFDDNNKEQILSLVGQLLALKTQNIDADTKNIELQINQLVYDLYDLKQKEIDIIDNYADI